MRYPDGHKAEIRERVLEAAARQVRERGLHSISLNSVMADAGLTHGSFYAHFPSKENFLSEVIEVMFATSPASILRDISARHEACLSDFVDYYLSIEHRDSLDTGCPLPVLAADAPRLSTSLRSRLSKGVSGMVDLVEGHLQALGRDNSRDVASSAVAEVVGAMVLARTFPVGTSSENVLANSRHQVRQRLGLSSTMTP